MDTFKLKVFAITAMLLDHIGAIFITDYHLNLILRTIGRLAFPIFVFLMIEGFYHTSNIKKYLTRMGIFAIVSEIPFDLAFYSYHTGANAVSDIQIMFRSTKDFMSVINKFSLAQNVFFTLFLGLLLITLMEYVDSQFKKNDLLNFILRNSLEAALVLIFCAAAYFMRTDYDMAGILMITVFYLFRGNKAVLALSTLIIMGARYCNFEYFYYTLNPRAILSLFAALAIIPIAFYNGKKGKDIKYFFYIFYPAHLFCLFLIELIL